MINRIKSFFVDHHAGTNTADRPHTIDEFHLAAAALLVHAALIDAHFGDDERETIIRLIESRLKLTPEEAQALFDAAHEEVDRSIQLHGFTHAVKNGFSYDERVELIEMLWEVAYADGHLHDYETNLVRRVSGLIHVPDRESGEARKRVLARLDLAEAAPF